MKSPSCLLQSALIFTLGLFLASQSSLAQPRERRTGLRAMPDSSQIHHMVDRLAEEIKLKDDQKAKVTEIYFKHFEEMDKIRKKHQGNRRDMMKSLRDLLGKQKEQIEKLLTDEQKKAYEKFLYERRERFRINRQRPQN